MDRIEVERSTDKYQPMRYAGASGDFNPIHIDPEFARAVGFERNIMHGLCTMAFVAKAVTDEAGGGDPRRLRRLKVRFKSPVLVEQSVTITGDPQDGVIALEARNDAGQTVVSNAEAEVSAGG